MEQMKANVQVRHKGLLLSAFIRGETIDSAAFLAYFRLQGSPLAVQATRDEAPKRDWTLHDSIKSRTTPKGFSVFATAPHTPFVVLGTKPHEIRPVHAKALRFFPSATGLIEHAGGGPLRMLQAAALQPVFAKKVMHPGTKPNPFFKRAKHKVKDTLKQLAKDILVRMYS